MDIAATINVTVAVIAIAAPLWALGMLLALGLARSAAEGDEAMAAYIESEYGSDPYDRAAREWMASQRRAS